MKKFIKLNSIERKNLIQKVLDKIDLKLISLDDAICVESLDHYKIFDLITLIFKVYNFRGIKLLL